MMISQPPRRILALALTLLSLSPAAPALAQDKDLPQAIKEVAADIRAQHQAAARDPKTPPTRPLGSSKTVRFALPMQKGRGSASVQEYCLGYTLKCVGKVTDPANTYSGRVSTSEGSQVAFQGTPNGDPLELTLQTSFWGDTTFNLEMWAQDEPWPETAQVEMTCSY